MNNNLLSRIGDQQPVLIAAEMSSMIEPMLAQASKMLDRIEASTEDPKMEDDFWFSREDWRSSYRPYVVSNGILHIPVKGVLLNDISYALGNYATGYTYIQKAFERGLDDPAVKGIALQIDSPGGVVAGNFDLVDKMFARREEKPVRAFAHESAYSAAYNIASVASEIWVSRTGGVGSIGVVTAHVDLSKMYEQAGIKVTFIHFGKHKVDGNPYQELPKEVKDRIQARIDELGEIFVASVARNRGMDEKAITKTEAATFTAKEGVSNGLADKIGTLEDATAEFSAFLDEEEDDEMADKNTGVDQAAHEAAVASARDAGHKEGLQAGAKAERDRISAIMNSDEGKKRPKAALSVAFKSEMSADQAKEFMADLPEEKAEKAVREEKNEKADTTFADAMKKTGNPDVNASNEEADADEKKPSRAEQALSLRFGPRKAS